MRGGLSYREAHMLMELVTDTGRLQALELVEVNPTVDTHHNTAELAVEFALAPLDREFCSPSRNQ
ncbi:MAG: arginase family protein [Acidobacteriota bacterium]|nr:arginase family protein [Acidobacteriota bacterium]